MDALAFLGGSAGGAEVLLILLVALLLFGAKSLPEIARNLGRTLEHLRRAANDVKDEVMKAAPMDDLQSGPPPDPPRLPAARAPEEDADDRVSR
jgi:sec-independent protein translocase protein TatA